MNIPFNKPYMVGKELTYITEAHASGHLSGDLTVLILSFLARKPDGLSESVVDPYLGLALEMAAILSGVGPGDEVIMPSYTFVSTANAFVLRGAVPVFVDIRPDTLNIDEKKN